MPAMRLDKLIAGSGSGTRSEAKKLIRAGRVTVDGKAVTDPAAHCDTDSEVLLDGERVVWQEYLYLMMNKPAGYLSVTEDPKAPTVLELLPPELRRRNLSPAGRLDKDSEGLLLLTSDGDFCHRVISPKSGIEKEYYIELDRPFPEGAEALFAAGAVLEDGEICLPARLEPAPDRMRALVFLREGKYHQVKRMAIAAGARVKYLKRLSVGGVALDPKLEPGEYRALTEEERRRICEESDNLHK
jgi:16S rRNA pseudouridine516 synthase